MTDKAISERPYRERLRADVFAIATRIVEREGLGALQARRVAAEAGCSVGSIYNVFGDLNGLIIALNVQTAAELGKVLTASFEATAGRDIHERLTGLALTYMRFAHLHPNRWRAVFEHRLTGTLDVPPGYRADRARLLALFENIIAAEMTDAMARTHAGRALFAAVHGIIALAIDGKLWNFDPEAAAAEIRFVVQAAANGLRPAR